MLISEWLIQYPNFLAKYPALSVFLEGKYGKYELRYYPDEFNIRLASLLSKYHFVLKTIESSMNIIDSTTMDNNILGEIYNTNNDEILKKHDQLSTSYMGFDTSGDFNKNTSDVNNEYKVTKRHQQYNFIRAINQLQNQEMLVMWNEFESEFILLLFTLYVI